MVVDLQTHFERKALQRLRAIIADPTHLSNKELMTQTAARVMSGRLVSLKDKDESFLPVISTQCNMTLQCH